jgi:uncharacterized Zn finger protein (UPF0148 family)
MQEHVCRDCGMPLPSRKAVCPVCGFDNRFDQQTDPIYPDTFVYPTDEVVPATIYGY